MKIAIDKNSIGAVEPKNEYIYLFDKEPLDELLKLKNKSANRLFC